MKPSKTLIALLCDAEGNVCIEGSKADKRLLAQAIKEVEVIEAFKEITFAYLAEKESADSLFRYLKRFKANKLFR